MTLATLQNPFIPETSTLTGDVKVTAGETSPPNPSPAVAAPNFAAPSSHAADRPPFRLASAMREAAAATNPESDGGLPACGELRRATQAALPFLRPPLFPVLSPTSTLSIMTSWAVIRSRAYAVLIFTRRQYFLRKPRPAFLRSLFQLGGTS
jgi:hypothetical protein